MIATCRDCGNRTFTCCDGLVMDGLTGRGAIAFQVDGAAPVHVGHVLSDTGKRLVCHGGCDLSRAISYDLLPELPGAAAMCAGIQKLARGDA